MTMKNDGGPAFPLQSIGPEFAPGYAGMSLRDYFAAKAMPAIYEQALIESRDGSDLFGYDDWRTGLALDAYKMADAMLKAREA